ncbi:putative uncharacterized protein [Coprobacillus sp. CAG:698]|mgnify:FL=1|nr:putative uncharacterized protein [Coprobacillus sp. CAG:698]
MKNLLFLALYDDDVKIGEALLIALISIIIVFSVLLLIIIIINLLQKLLFTKKDVKNEKPLETKKENQQTSVKKTGKNTEIKDEDMMVAALIATIDYTNETKKDVRLVSIKQIR